MTVLFCHDHRFVIRDGRVWTTGALDAETFAAYERVFGPVTVAARLHALAPGEDPAKLSLTFDDVDRLVAIPNLSSPLNLVRPDPAAVRKLRAAVAATDIVIARLPSEIGLLALREARRAGKPAIVEVVGSWIDALSRHGGRGAKLYAPVAEWRMRRAVARADYVHYVSAEFLQLRYPNDKMTVGVSDVMVERPGPEVLEGRLARIGDARPLVFGMVAVISNRQKGVDIAIKALAEARRTDPGLELKVLGPGDPEPWRAVAAEQGVADAVELCGPAPRGDAVLDWIDGIDVYVQASFQEGLPRALIEAMRQATPALASTAGGTPELVREPWLHTPGDVAKLAAQMLAVRPAEVRAEMARTNFATALPYSLDAVTRRRETFWRAVMADAGIAA
ncbi:glycosyltransferase family 4 protein [Sphingomonas sp. LB-2]|uniref:glycosyltransferase family 4 protein n=1 Tax=Sphingomonas caeni TaxID=2984949 RepID=UPI002231F299|nr:glycosyltransferase family 4 protein [Sphingomonas caeni]MCW3848507.1 glycosyltransferase family 4 protein [Sphingomonas caeni]